MRIRKWIGTCVVWLCMPAYGALNTHPMDWQPIIGRHIPLDVSLHDEANRRTRLEYYFGQRPVIMMLGYYKCPSLCAETFAGTIQALHAAHLESGRDYELVVVSIDPGDNAATARLIKQHSRIDDHDAAYVHFLTANSAAIDRLTNSIGFDYRYDKTSHQFSYPAGLLILSREGAINQYLPGVRFSPKQLGDGIFSVARDIPITFTERLRLLRYHFDLQGTRYTSVITHLVSSLGIVSSIILILMWRRQWRTS